MPFGPSFERVNARHTWSLNPAECFGLKARGGTKTSLLASPRGATRRSHRLRSSFEAAVAEENAV